MMRQAFDFDSTILTLPTIGFTAVLQPIKTGFWRSNSSFTDDLNPLCCCPFIHGRLGFLVWKSMQPKFSRLSLLKGLKRMISLKGLVEMVKALFKFLLVAIVAILVLKGQIPALLSVASFPLTNALSSGLELVTWSFLMISASLILIAAVDVPFQLYEHKKQLKMTKQELKDEFKETEGKPEVKSQIRRTQQEIARRRMMSEVPKANVVLTNPTHYAVAICYQQQGNRAPIVVAKGRDLIALHINRIAQSHQIPILSVPPLARALYYSTDLNTEIPRGLYVAVAQVLAYIFQLRDKANYDKKPEFLQNLPIPDELKRDVEENV
jgi:flagellar biosynthetic protein FlhB